MKKIFGSLLAIFLMVGIAYAHNGMQHVMGTVVSMTSTSITVKTMNGKTQTVDVDANTKYSERSRAITMQDLKAGDRVVIHAAKKEGKLVAATVEVGTAGSVAHSHATAATAGQKP